MQRIQKSERVRIIQVFDPNNQLLIECSKNYSFPAKTREGAPVSLNIKGRRLPVLEVGGLVDVVFNTMSGARIKYFCVVEHSTARQLGLSLNSEKAKRFIERRRFYKIKTAINCRITDIMRDGTVNAFNPNLYGKIHDISLGGIFIAIQSGEKYKEGDIISFTTILGEHKLELSAKILRGQINQIGEFLGYGCSFVDIKSHQEDAISSYVNRIQIEDRRLEIERKKLELKLNQNEK